MTTGLWVALGAVVLALVFGAYRQLTDGKAKEVSTGKQGTLTAAELGQDLGAAQTFVQFSSEVCSACRSTARTLQDLSAQQPDVSHIELLAENNLHLVERFNITRTPTVLVLDASGTVRQRIVGGVRNTEAPKLSLCETSGQGT